MRATPAALLILATLVAACSGGRSRSAKADQEEGAGSNRRSASSTLTIKGSDTMVILAQRWAEAFMQRHPDATVQVSGGGSGTGIAALINGTTTLANASRPMEPEEKGQVAERRGAAPVETAVALDAIAIYVHKDNPLEKLSLDQLAQIFRGRTEQWKEVGSDLGQIVLYSRENNSGTYAFFKEKVLDDLDFAPQAQTLPGTAAVIQAVSRDVRGIGYGGIGYAEGVRTVPIELPSGEAVEATMENAVSGRYPLARNLFIYAAGKPEGVAERFLTFVLGDEGQRLVEGVGYYPLPDPEDAPGDAEARAKDEKAAAPPDDEETAEKPTADTAAPTAAATGDGDP